MSVTSIQSPKHASVTLNQFTSNTFTASDAAYAATLQAEADRQVAQQYADEHLASKYCPWKSAEDEWAKVEQKQNVEADAKMAAKLSLTDEINARRRLEKQQAVDAEFAKRLQANPNTGQEEVSMLFQCQ